MSEEILKKLKKYMQDSGYHKFIYNEYEEDKCIDIINAIDRLQEENRSLKQENGELKDYKERTENTIKLAKFTKYQYNKLGEEYHKLKLENEILKGTNDDLNSLYLEEKRKNKELVEEFPKILEEATKNAISKDKIKDKIKECEEIERKLDFIKNESYARKRNKDFIILLKDLLKE